MTNTVSVYHVAFGENDQRHFQNIYDMLELVKKGTLTKETYVWKKGMGNRWIKAGKVPELKPLFAMPPGLPEELREEFQLPD